MESKDFSELFNQMAKLLDKTHQVQRMYDNIWKERIEVYQDIIVSLKKGGGIFRKKPDIMTDYADSIKRLDTLNKRENQILSIILEHKKETLDLKKKIVVDFEKSKIGEQKISKIFPIASIEALSSAVDHYLNSTSTFQQNFLTREETFIKNPSKNTLNATYCLMKHLMAEIEIIDKEYDNKSISHQQIINIRHNFNNLVSSVSKKESELPNDESTNKSKLILGEVSIKLQPYFNPNDRQLYGTFAQRVSLNTTDFTKIIVSIGFRMAFIAPLLMGGIPEILGYKPSMRIVPFKEYPQFYLDMYLFLISYLAYVLDVIPGLAKYSIEYPKKLFALASQKLSSKDEYVFAC